MKLMLHSDYIVRVALLFVTGSSGIYVHFKLRVILCNTTLTSTYDGQNVKTKIVMIFWFIEQHARFILNSVHVMSSSNIQLILISNYPYI